MASYTLSSFLLGFKVGFLDLFTVFHMFLIVFLTVFYILLGFLLLPGCVIFLLT